MAMTKSIHELGVIETAEAVAKGELTPEQVVDSLLARIDALEPRILAWSYMDREDIRRQATALTQEAKAGRLRGPLHGVPAGIKDEFYVKGQPTGFKGEGAQPETEDATPVARLREAGAIIMGKTWMPVGGKVPPTRNPWNTDHTAGGSSSGSGASVGARMVPVALGEQTVGSNLRPAAYCGVSAIKPTFGRVSRFGCYPFTWSLDHPGVIGRSMADMALVLSVISGQDPRDRATLPDPAPPAQLTPLERPPRLGIVRNFFPEQTEAEVLQAIEEAGAKLREAGATVSDFLLPDDFGLMWPISRLINGAESGTFNARKFSDPWGEAANTAAAATGSASVNRAMAAFIPASYYLQSMRIRGWVDTKVRAAIDTSGLDALVMAVAPSTAPKGLSNTGDPVLLGPWTTLGYPALALCTGLSGDGLPLAVQMVAPSRQDYRLLQVGEWCEQVLGVLPAPPL